MTKRRLSLVKATDVAIAEENAKFLADPTAVAEAQAEGDLYRQRLEAEGVLPKQRVTIPDPYATTPEMDALYKRIAETRAFITNREAIVAKLLKARKWRETRAPHLVEKYDDKIAVQEDTIRIAKAGLLGEEAQLEALTSVRDAQTREYWDGINLLVDQRFGGESDVYIRPSGQGGYEVSLTTGKILSRHAEGCATRVKYVVTNPEEDAALCNCEKIEFPETRFGFSTTIYGPRRGWKPDEGWTPAYLSFGSYSGMDTVALARDMIRVHRLATDIAEFVNETVGL